jgi:hypothetical protein
MILFFSVIAVVLLGMSYYVHRRAAEALTLGSRGRWALFLFLVAGAVATIAGRAFGLPALSTFGFTVELAVIISVALLLPVEAVRGLGSAYGWVKRAQSAVPDAETQPLLVENRRSFLTRAASGSALFVGGSSSVYGSLLGRHDYQIEDVPVVIAGLPPTLDGYTIVQLSDIHFGSFVGEPELAAAIEHVRRARPDLVVMTGDLVDHDAAYAPLLGRLVRAVSEIARDGVAVIPGNHDYYTGVAEVLEAARRGGARILVNSGRLYGDAGGHFGLLGVDDVWTARNGFDGGPDLDRALRTVPGDVPRILLCHNPEFFPEAAGKVALQLSGHTHGGQIALGINPAEIVLPHGYVRGAYSREGSTLYVNRGFGTAGPPARVGSPPEITRVILTAA